MTVNVMQIMMAVTAYVEHAPTVDRPTGLAIAPQKVVFETRGDKARAVVHGPVVFGTNCEWKTVHFNIQGYDRYPPAPSWVEDVLKETGAQL